MDPSSAMLTDKVAIVTGAGRGIGKGIAVTFARFGAHVVVADRDEVAGEATAAAIRDLGRRGLSIPTDVRKFDQVKAMVKRTVDTLGGVDILVNNAGGTRRVLFLEMGEERWRRMVEMNMMALYYCTDAAVRAMIAGGRKGSIINISSIEGSRAAPYYSVYAAGKAGMDNFTRTLALELAEYGIRVNSIAPDVIATERNTEAMAAMDQRAVRQAIPMGRTGTAEEVAGAAIYLASGLSTYTTGTIVHVDGGTWASGGWLRDEKSGWTLFPNAGFPVT